MSVKLDKQPLCRYCGAPIRKATSTVHFGCAPSEKSDWCEKRTERPASRKEAQRLVNEQIVSVRYGTTATEEGEPIDASMAARFNAKPGTRFTKTVQVPRYVKEASVWDGESYNDGFFCKGEHAMMFGYAAARYNEKLAMPEYHKALAARDAEAE